MTRRRSRNARSVGGDTLHSGNGANTQASGYAEVCWARANGRKKGDGPSARSPSQTLKKGSGAVPGGQSSGDLQKGDGNSGNGDGRLRRTRRQPNGPLPSATGADRPGRDVFWGDEAFTSRRKLRC